MSGRCVDVLKRVKSLIGRYTDVNQSWVVGCDGRPGSFPTMHVLCRLCSRSPNDLTRLPNALSTTALNPRPLPIVLNSSKQSGIVGNTSTKFTDFSGPSKTHPRSFPTSARLHKTSPDHPGRERSAVKSAKCDRGFNSRPLPIILNR